MRERISDRDSVSWYEATLSSGERKRRGHFSTPAALVDQILDACGYSSTADLSGLRLLDPACGSGNFLARAALRLACSLKQQNLDSERIGAVVTRNIWGLDPDPVACFLAEMQIRATLASVCGDNACRTVSPLHIHQADSLALSWQPCVDLLLANPPYLAAKNTDLSFYHLARQRGQVDSYLLFLDLALRVVRPGGWIGLVLPDPVLARANALPERSRLLSECTLQHIWHLSGVFAAEVGAVVIIAQKAEPRALHRVHWTRAGWRSGATACLPGGQEPRRRVGQALLARQPGTELRYLLGSEVGRTVERLRRALEEARSGASLLVSLEQLVTIKRGEEIGRESESLAPLAELAEQGYPVLRGGIDLRPYLCAPTGWGIRRSAVRKPLERYFAPKLLVVKSAGRLQASLDRANHVVLQTLYLLRLRAPWQEEDSLDTSYFLLGLLNSRLLRAYVYHLHTAYKLVQPQIEQAVLRRLPVVWGLPDQQQKIAGLARELEQACSVPGPVVEWKEKHRASLYEEQERAIGALYAAAIPDLFAGKGACCYD